MDKYLKIMSKLLIVLIIMLLNFGFIIENGINAECKDVNLSHKEFIKKTDGGKECNNFGYNSFWANTINSYLEQKSDGTYQRIEGCEDGVYIESYSNDFVLTNSIRLEKPLKLFGGYFNGNNYNFIVFGDENQNESDNAEVIRIVKYDKNWKYINSCSIKGINTKEPFSAGSLRMTEVYGTLFIHTCHEMYKSPDGLNHQSNMTIAVDIATMTVIQSRYNVGNIEKGYVSHSFNQFIVTDGDYIYCLDHGDAYPRSVVLTKYTGNNIESCSYTNILNIAGHAGNNATGVSVGGFALQQGNLITVGSSVVQSEEVYDTQSQRNIFVAVTDKELKNTSFKWLTLYVDGDEIRIDNIKLVPCSDGCYVLWEESDSNKLLLTKILKIDKAGNKVESVHTIYARLSECQPIITSDNKLVWYNTTSYCSLVFYQLDLRNLDSYEFSGKGRIEDCVVSLDQNIYEYSPDVSAYKPIPTVKYGDYTLEPNEDYTISYKGGYMPGISEVIITGKDFFEGSQSISYEIIKNKPAATESPSPASSLSYTYRQYNLMTDVMENKKDQPNKDSLFIPGKVNGIKIKTVSTKAIRVSWNKVKKASYYRVYVAGNRRFTKSLKKYISYSNKILIKNLKKNVLFVRVCAVNYRDGKKSCGKWSVVRKVSL